ncbi:MAG: RsmE family RNA methyltransferase [Verrucomicrobiota bacterium]
MSGYRSFLFPDSEVGKDFLFLDRRESHHLVRVLRAQSGEAVEVLDGKGKRYRGILEITDPKAVKVGIQSVETVENFGPKIRLVQALSKGRAMDLILRMATEIGASEIQPVFTDQGEVQIKGDRLKSKVEKWRLTMIESCKQCGLPFLPKLEQPVSLKEWLRNRNEGSDVLSLVASLEEGSRPVAQVLEDSKGSASWVEVAIGPEGDFSSVEYELLKESGFRAVRLGANILRAETATAYTLAVIDQIRLTQSQAK